MNMKNILKDVQKGIYNQCRYGNMPKTLICTPEVAEFIIEYHQGQIVDEDGIAYILGLQIVPRTGLTSFYVR